MATVNSMLDPLIEVINWNKETQLQQQEEVKKHPQLTIIQDKKLDFKPNKSRLWN